MSETLRAARVVTATAVHEPGWVRIGDVRGDDVGVASRRILAVGAGDPPAGDPQLGDPQSGHPQPGDPRAGDPRPEATPPNAPTADRHDTVRDLGDATVVPGFIDLHVHGGGGGSYVGASMRPDLAARAAAAHRAHGTTSTLASLVTSSPQALLADVTALSALADAGDIAGIHLEGPWLSPARAGAHDITQLRHPDPAEIDALLAAARGWLRLVTIAPELPGALEAIRRFSEAGVVVALGHTDADYATTRAGVAAGARSATHLFNAMRPLDHREPGPALALIEDPRVAVELIADGAHLHPAVIAAVREAVGSDRVLLVTDAMAAAAQGDGNYQLGDLAVEVRDGIAHLAGTDTIAGSTATMHQLFRAAAATCELRAAVRQTSSNQARLMGWHDRGDIAPGMRADLVVLDPRLELREVVTSNISTSR